MALRDPNSLSRHHLPTRRLWLPGALALALVALALGAAACRQAAPAPPTAVPTPTYPPIRVEAAPTSTPFQPAQVATPTATRAPAPTAPASPTREPAIYVTAPTRDQAIRSPVRIAGRARVFEAAVRYEIVADGRVIGQGHTTASAGAPEWGTFAADLSFTPPASATTGVVRVFSTSMKDGSVENLVEVPVRIQPGPPAGEATAAPTPTKAATRRLTVYFPRATERDVTFVPVTREVPATPAVGRAALQELLKGPTPEERAKGLYSPIPAGTRLLDLKIVEGTAYADFDRGIERGMGGSLRVMAVRRSIELTLKQFSTVQRVVISVEGRTEDVLQP